MTGQEPIWQVANERLAFESRAVREPAPAADGQCARSVHRVHDPGTREQVSTENTDDFTPGPATTRPDVHPFVALLQRSIKDAEKAGLIRGEGAAEVPQGLGLSFQSGDGDLAARESARDRRCRPGPSSV